MMKQIDLPSGAKLGVQVAPFADSKALYQAMLKELRGADMRSDKEIDTNFIKDLVCIGLSSKEVDAALDVCLKRCTYKGEKITDSSFESVESRQDYLKVLFEVAKANIEPFLNGLLQEFEPIFQKLKSDLA